MSASVSIIERRLIGSQRRNRITINLGEGASHSVPLPPLADMGLVRELQHLNVLDQPGDSYWRRDGGYLFWVGSGERTQLLSVEAVGW